MASRNDLPGTGRALAGGLYGSSATRGGCHVAASTEGADIVARATGEQGVVYLIHLDTKLAHSQHYLGWAHTERLEARLKHHARGTGARFMAAVGEAGIGWCVSRTWTGDRHLERRLKNRNGASRFCPACLASKRTPAHSTEEVA